VRVLIRRERIELLRDPISLVIIFSLPLLTLVLFTFALATEVTDMPLAICDEARSPRTRELVQAVESTGYFALERVASLDGIGARIANGELAGVLVIPPDIEKRFAQGQIAEVQLVLDGAQSISAANAEAILSACVASFEPRVELHRAAVLATTSAPTLLPAGRNEAERGRVRVERRTFANPRLDSEHFMVPGLLGYIFTFLTIVISSLAIVRERVMGTFEHLLVTPASASEILTAKLVVLGTALLVNLGLVMLLGGVCFGVWPRGSLALLLGTTALYLGVTLSIGLLISSRSKTPEEAIQMALVASSPLLNISGLVFPVSAMPRGFQIVANVLPVSHYLRLTRVIYLMGGDLRDVAGDVLVVTAYFVGLLWLVTRVLGKARTL
jgi:ABC-2 type transport system permease protein